MANLTEKLVIDQITVLEDGQIQIRQTRKIFDSGVEIAKKYHRYVLAPGDDISAQDARIKTIASADWTPARVAAFRAKQPVV